MADWLIQRYLHNLTNEIRRESGVWEDCFVITGMTANQAQDAAAQALGNVAAAVPAEADVLRALRWDNATQFTAPMGPRVLSEISKTGPPTLPGAGTA